MKNSIANVQKRRSDILSIIQEKEEASVELLCQLCDVSPSTIRRDLDAMYQMGVLTRTHGGAKLHDQSLSVSEPQELVKLRHALAKAASLYVKSGDILSFNSSQTALYVLNYLFDMNLIIVTNNVEAIRLHHDTTSTLIMTGGEIRLPKEAMVGDIAINSITNITSTISILGCNGIDPIHGVTTENISEAKVNSFFFENTVGKRIVVADYRKIGARAPFKSVSCSMVDILITDIFAPANIVAQLRKQGIDVIQIDPNL
ncbi:MAG: DeoR/GlpR transcriptional regulator [Erysipelothrix sp.]|nr:DeoR/GlpR transcriptional regulator [Erysipelothrix sp.]